MGDGDARLLQMAGVVVEEERGVPHQEEGVDLEGQLRRILHSVECAGLLRSPDQLLEQLRPISLHRRDLVLDRAGTGAHLQRRPGEKAPAGEGATLQVLEERVVGKVELQRILLSLRRRVLPHDAHVVVHEEKPIVPAVGNEQLGPEERRAGAWRTCGPESLVRAEHLDRALQGAT